MDIEAWLGRLGLKQYESVFRENDIDDEVLPRLTAEDLISMGITSAGHRRKLLDAAAVLRAGSEPETRRMGFRRSSPRGKVSDGRSLCFSLILSAIPLSASRFFNCVDRLVEEHGGHVDKHMGDCVMAVFGAPVSRGNDAERAVRAALAIRNAMPALSVELEKNIFHARYRDCFGPHTGNWHCDRSA